MNWERRKRFALWFGVACLVAIPIGAITGDYGGAGELAGVALFAVLSWDEHRRRQRLKAERRYRHERHYEPDEPGFPDS
jgi:hypothetical protein